MLDKAYGEKIKKWAEENKTRVKWRDPVLWITDGKYTINELDPVINDCVWTYGIDFDNLYISSIKTVTDAIHNKSLEELKNIIISQYGPDFEAFYDAKDLSDLSRETAKLIAKSGYFTPFPIYNENDKLSDFIYKVDETKTLKVITNYSSIQEYFEAEYEDHDDLDIIAIGIEEPIITMHKVKKNDEIYYSFHVDIVSDNGNSFITHTTFKTSDEFRNLLIKTIDYIKDFKGFEKYIEDLQNCL